MNSLIVYPEGIFYIKKELIEENTYFLIVCEFNKDTGESRELYRCTEILRYGGYHLFYDADQKGYCFSGDNGSYALSINGIPTKISAVDGKLYYQPQFMNCVSVMDLSTGEYYEIIPPEKSRINDYTVFNGKIYLIVDHELYCYEDGKVRFLSELNIDQIYSGPDALYVYAGGASDSYDFNLAKVTVNDNGVFLRDIT